MVVCRASVVRSMGVVGSRGMVIPADETTKMAITDQFFYFILEYFVVFCGVAMIAVVAAILGHIGIRRSGGLAWWRDEVSYGCGIGLR